MADLYRKAALERISSPEQLDKALKVTSPMSWLALLGVTLIVVVTVIWSIIGTIPVTVTAPGMVSAVVGSNAVYASESGTVVAVLVRSGDELHLNTPILTYKTAANEIKTVYSDQVGTVYELVAQKDGALIPGGEVVRVTPKVQGSQMVVCYVPLAQAKKLERGMQVNVSVNSLDSQSYGTMAARIVNIDGYAISQAGMASVIGTGNNLDAAFSGGNPVVAVACELAPGNTQSGYYWSNEKGAQAVVTNGSLVSAKIITEEVAPISKLFSMFGEL